MGWVCIFVRVLRCNYRKIVFSDYFSVLSCNTTSTRKSNIKSSHVNSTKVGFVFGLHQNIRRACADLARLFQAEANIKRHLVYILSTATGKNDNEFFGKGRILLTLKKFEVRECFVEING